MKQPFNLIVLLLSILIFGKSAIAQQQLKLNNSEFSQVSLLDSLDDCSKYTLKISIYNCYTRSDFEIEVYKDEQGYYTLFCNAHKLSLSPQGCEMKYARLSAAQFTKLGLFEMNLDKGHEHKQSCRSTTYVNIDLNNTKKHFQHCGCGSSAYAEIKNILLADEN